MTNAARWSLAVGLTTGFRFVGSNPLEAIPSEFVLIVLFGVFHVKLDLQLQDETGGDISSFVTNGEWELIGIYVIDSLEN